MQSNTGGVDIATSGLVEAATDFTSECSCDLAGLVLPKLPRIANRNPDSMQETIFFDKPGDIQ